MTPNLELAALRWLKFERRCMIVIRERSPRETFCGRPDCLGVTAARHATEIEIKRTLADFVADANKASRRHRELFPERYPKLFYYLVPSNLVCRVSERLPEWSGLMTAEDGLDWVQIIRPAPVNRIAKRYSLRECVQLASLQSNYLVASEQRAHRLLMTHPEAALVLRIREQLASNQASDCQCSTCLTARQLIADIDHATTPLPS